MPPDAAGSKPLSLSAPDGMTCLWIARYIPYPLDAGAKVYSAKLAESLAASGVTVRFMGIGAGAAIPANCAHVDWLPIATERRSNIVSLFSPLPNAAAVDASDAYILALEQQLAEDWDAIVLDGYGTGWALTSCMRYRARRTAARTMLIHVSHNHEGRLWRAMARDSRASPLRKLILWQNYHKVRALERRIVRAVDLLTTITEEDRVSLSELGEKRTLTLTPGYDGWAARERRIGIQTPRRVILMGSFRWVVKQENLARFVELADPVFSRHGIELDVVGDVAEQLVAALRRGCRATHFHGFVKEVSALFANARIAVVPEAIGGGFKLKFLDYFFGRVPVATLRHAAAGLPPELREQTLACEDLPALVEAVVSNIDRLDMLNQMQDRAFAHSSLRFTWRERAANLRQAMVSTRHG